MEQSTAHTRKGGAFIWLNIGILVLNVFVSAYVECFLLMGFGLFFQCLFIAYVVYKGYIDWGAFGSY